MTMCNYLRKPWVISTKSSLYSSKVASKKGSEKEKKII